MNQRARDGGRFAAWWGRWGRDLVVAVAVAFAAWSVIGTQNTIGNLEEERTARTDESCRINETKQRSDVDALKRTYEYLAGLNARQLAEPLNKAVLAGLPSTIREAQTDDAPSYCDEKGVGLPEPDPVLPDPPDNLPSR